MRGPAMAALSREMLQPGNQLPGHDPGGSRPGNHLRLFKAMQCEEAALCVELELEGGAAGGADSGGRGAKWCWAELRGAAGRQRASTAFHMCLHRFPRVPCID